MKKYIILYFFLVAMLVIIFPHELKYYFREIKPLNLKPIYTIATDKKYKFDDGSDISEEEIITIPQEIINEYFPLSSMYWIVSEDGNNIYIFKGVVVSYGMPVDYLDLKERKAFVYVINLKTKKIKKIQIKKFAPPPFAEGLAVRDIKEKNGKIYFFTNSGISVFNKDFKMIDFYIFEDIANLISKKTKEDYYNKNISVVGYSHGKEMMIDKNENIHIISNVYEYINSKKIHSVIYRKYSSLNKKEKYFGYTIYGIKKEYEIKQELFETSKMESFLLEDKEIPYLLIFEENINNQEYNLYKKINRLALWKITEDGITERNKIIDTRYSFRYEQITHAAELIENNLYLLTTDPKMGYTNTGNLCFIKKYEIKDIGLVEKNAKIFLNFGDKEPVQPYKFIPTDIKIKKINNILCYYVYDKFYERFVIFKEIE
ncbi:hypothetical protein X275_04465 [Marinitoga sp. 1197]|uniref:hypothetical protein n=1 Tax=Marinitoga sp. 1197 TaxID=1428449 RepID=UPI0006411F65|nr:hypothetical protein [Marinitoga sp. 1197]KLO22838.1 hypothetical protein X275_04465 [Marinitoga sp. 1197]